MLLRYGTRPFSSGDEGIGQSQVLRPLQVRSADAPLFRGSSTPGYLLAPLPGCRNASRASLQTSTRRYRPLGVPIAHSANHGCPEDAGVLETTVVDCSPTLFALLTASP